MIAALLKLLPRIGRPWPGGTYCGLVDRHHIVVGPLAAEKVDWAKATDWARGLELDGRRDFLLPTLAELEHIDELFPRLLRPEPFWSCEPVPGTADIWTFWPGAPHPQSPWGRVYPCYAIAVRRLSHTELS